MGVGRWTGGQPWTGDFLLQEICLHQKHRKSHIWSIWIVSLVSFPLATSLLPKSFGTHTYINEKVKKWRRKTNTIRYSPSWELIHWASLCSQFLLQLSSLRHNELPVLQALEEKHMMTYYIWKQHIWPPYKHLVWWYW